VTNLSPNSTSAALAGELAQATRGNLRLSEALQAAAEGAQSRKLRMALEQVATRLERGETLEHVLANDSPLPPHLSGLMRAALATGQPGQAIAEWLLARERARAYWNNILAALYYPLATLLAAYALFIGFSLWLIPELRATLEMLKIELPEAVLAIYWVTGQGAYVSLIVLGILAVILLLIRVLGGKRGWSLFMSTVPLFGSLWHWSGSSELYRALALLLEQRLPLPEALRLTSQGIADAALARHCEALAAQLEQGTDFTHAVQRSPELPASTLPLLRSGERAGDLVAGLRAAADMLESRLQAQSSLLLHLAPAVIFIAVLGMALMMVVGFVIPLLTLIRGLA
jgi:general secretion pathway protein F